MDGRVSQVGPGVRHTQEVEIKKERAVVCGLLLIIILYIVSLLQSKLLSFVCFYIHTSSIEDTSVFVCLFVCL